MTNETHIALPNGLLARLLLLTFLMVVGTIGMSGQVYRDGIYLIKNDKDFYLWPSVVTNSSTGQKYLTTLQTTSANSTQGCGTTFDKSYSHWVVKNIDDTKFQIIHPRLGKYVVIRDKGFGDRDVWLDDLPANLVQTYFTLNGTSAPYLLSPTDCFQTASNCNLTNRTLNSAVGGDKDGLGSGSGTDITDQRSGLLQFFTGSPKWSFIEDKLDAPTIHYDEKVHSFTISYDQIPSGFEILYTTNGNDPTVDGEGVNTYTGIVYPMEAGTVKAVVAHYGIVLTEVASQVVEPAGTPPDPVISVMDECNNIISITPDGPTIYYTIDGSEPSKSNGFLYTGPFQQNTNVTIKAVTYFADNRSENIIVKEYIAKTAIPAISVSGNTVTITGSGDVFYTLNGEDPTEGDRHYTGPFNLEDGSGLVTIKAIAREDGKYFSCPAETTVKLAYFINSAEKLSGITADADCIVTENIDASSYTGEIENFSGTFDGGMHTISGLSQALFNSINGGTVRNVILKDVSISSGTNVGAIANEATGASRIYNCGIVPSATERDADGNITGFTGSSISGSGNVGSLVGLLDGTSRVINCFSYATVGGGSMMGGIVGNNNTNNATQANYTTKTIVMNCMFYGEISGGSPGTAFPVYGGNVIANDGTTAINNYNYYRGEAAFDDNYTDVANYNRSWPAEERNLTRFEYYRSILNSNRRLCTFWMTDHDYASQTADDMSLMAKWVLDPSIAPYPILKEWGTYPSIINADPEKTWNPQANGWTDRSSASAYQGKKIGTLTVTVNTGSHPGTLTGLTEKSETLTLAITDMDTLNCDYGYAKVQLPYYNEVFGDPSASDHLTRYYGNYTNKVVTAWKITAVTDDGRTRNAFVKNWQTGYNYADRNCTEKDLYDKNDGRAFAQGGYYYVPEGVTAITIEAYWGTAFYLHGKDHAVDRVNVTNNANYGNAFSPAGTLPTKWNYNNMDIYDDLGTVMGKLSNVSTVYDQAIVLVGNFQVQALNGISLDGTGKRVTFMSADLDLDNEPDFCWQFQWRSNYDRRPILPVRFDFLPISELGLAIRHNTYAYAIGIFVPKGHFEITETAFMHTTQFEYMSTSVSAEQHPLILNGGEFEQIVSHGNKNNPTTQTSTRNIIMGGHVWMKRFTPGSHSGQYSKVRHCAVSVMGGDFPEFYLSGLYWTGCDSEKAYADSPHCYTNGGRFGIMAGAGMEAVKNDVHFEIDHSVIDEFYGGGINANNPVGGNIEVTINNSLVNDKYCGGPKVGTSGTVTTHATNTIFNQYFGGGNGGTNLYRETIKDETPNDMPNASTFGKDYGWNGFTPISNQGSTATYDAAKGYHAEFEFEVFNQSNGINASAVARTYRHWAQFGTTETGNVTNGLTGCTLKHNFYGGGNLGNVTGTVTSTLTDCTVMGNAYGAGYSAAIPHFPVHDKESVTFPTRDKAGVCHNGSVGYRKDGGVIRQYTWCYKNPETGVVSPAGVVIPSGVSTSKPAFQYNGDWYCYTTVSLENLGTVSGKVTLNIEGTTTVTNVYGGGESSNAAGDVEVNINNGTMSNVFGGGEGQTTVVGGDVTVNVGAKSGEGTLSGSGTVTGSVYGGSALGTVNAAAVNIYGGSVAGSVFGGGLGQTSPSSIAAQNLGDATVTVEGGTVSTAVYGGSNANGVLKQDAKVTITGGTVGTAPTGEDPIPNTIFGGGFGQPTLVEGNVVVNIGTKSDDATPVYTGNAIINGHVYGGGALGNTNASIVEGVLTANAGKTTKVNLYKGTIKGNSYGGGLGDDETAAIVGGDVTVTLDGAVTTDSIFGCNNLNGTPKGHVKVHVMRTVNIDSEKNELKNNSETALASRTTYDVAAVYGGGNQADYNPTKATGTDEEKKDAFAEVLIEGCDQTSIEYVYGSGNAAAVPATQVTINSAYIIDQLFGGGNGAGEGNPGANVGIYNNNGTPTNYGTGIAKTKLVGGQVHYVYGGSNTKGNVRGGTSLERKDSNDCSLVIGELYGAGQIAPMDGNVDIQLDCMPKEFVEAVYGGAKNATINGNVSLTVRSGKFGRVFGGNNLGGSINGSITVNAYEGGCEPLIIGELYGGGYNAPYSIYGCNDDDDDGDWTPNAEEGEPHVVQDAEHPAVGVYVWSCTSIGKVFGGGYGATADVVGNTRVWINLQKGFVKDVEQPNIGKIGQVFGGGNMGKVKGNVSIEIGTETSSDDIGVNIIDGDDYLKPDGSSISIEAGIYGGGNEADVDGDVTLHIGTENQKVDDEPSITIEGDIFGGGYGASTHVTGSVAINIGERTAGSDGTYTYTGNATITGDVYGGSALGSVNSSDNANATNDATTSVTLNTGTITGSIYGGGYGQQKSGTEGEEGYVEPFEANVYGPVTVTVYNGAVSESVYGCNNKNGSPKNNVNVVIAGTAATIPAVYGGGNKAPYTGGRVLSVSMSGGSVTDVFGGGLGTTARVGGNTAVTLSGDGAVGNDIYGGGSLADVQGAVSVTLNGGTVARDVYGGGALAQTNTEYTANDDIKKKYETTVTLAGATVTGNVYGGGLGDETTAANVGGPVTVTVSGGQAANVFGCNNQNGAPQSTVTVNVEGTAAVTGGSAVGNVYGGGNVAAYTGSPEVKVSGGTVNNVYGGGLGETAIVTGSTSVTITGTGKVNNNVFGGGSQADVTGSVNVTISGGEVINDVYGGGALANTNTANWDAEKNSSRYDEVSYITADESIVTGFYTKSGDTYTEVTAIDAKAEENTTYYRKLAGDWADGKNNSSEGTTYKTEVVLAGGIIGNAYGGGLGSVTLPVYVFGDVSVSVNDPAIVGENKGAAFTRNIAENVTVDGKNYPVVPLTGSIFGANNMNGTPLGNVTVTVFSTRQIDESKNYVSGHSPNSTNKNYEVQAVYGGGNQADYLPADGKKTKVIIWGCDETSIEKVYGGGNSASVPATDVTIWGSYDIGYAFGGGNGSKPIYRDNGWLANAGARVKGNVTILCKGGKIGSVFGGSDARGDILGTITTDVSHPEGGCQLKITRLFGAGNEADVDGDVDIIVSGCASDEIEYICGGSYNANIRGDVKLTITGGNFKSVYGGNDARGTIGGNIIVDIEETDDCRPVIIQNLIGGGNEAAYPGDGAKRKVGEGLYEDFTRGTITVNVKSATRIDNVYGGAFKADVNGDTKVNINMTKGRWAGKYFPATISDGNGGTTTNTNSNDLIPDALGIIGNVFGGGNEGNVNGNTKVNIGTEKKVGIMKRDAHGEIVDEDDSSVYDEGGHIIGTIAYDDNDVLGANITGDVFGGGDRAVVTGSTEVNICTADYSETTGFEGVSIGGSVYGGGSKADVKKNTTVTMAGGYVFDGVYGGGLQGSVGTFTRTPLPDGHTHDGCIGGKPDEFTDGTGKCTVVVSGGQVGPVEVALAGGGMKNTRGYYLESGETGPVDYGFVFGAGRGEVVDPDTDPDADFRVYVKETEVTISGTALVMASVYGGGENGRVRGDTKVKIQGGQIGCGEGKTAPYTEEQWTGEDPSVFTECAHWEYEAPYLPHDPLADVPYSPNNPVTDGSTTATDGHTYYGSVFGGGSGYYPYEIKDASGNVIGHDWLRSAGVVEGSTKVLISGGHILTSVYGGNEYTDVTGDSCVVIMTGGTLGVPRTDDDMQKHPVTCYLFGAGKGDQRTHFNTWTNVQNTRVYVGGTARIFGSVFGGGEDGHVLENAKVQICGGTIGTTGTSYVDGNVFGGGRGYSGVALTAGSIGGNVEVKITGGTMLGSVYGGGRLASVGIGFTDSTDPSYGQLRDDASGEEYGHIKIDISGGTIGTTTAAGDADHPVGGNVFGGSMGRITLLDGSLNPLWPKLAVAKLTEVTISGTADIKNSVFGGSEYGVVRNLATVNVKGGTIHGDVFGGGYGSDDERPTTITAGGYADIPTIYYTFTPKIWTGCVSGSTEVNISGGTVEKNVYGGSELASVGLINCNVTETENGPFTYNGKKYDYAFITKHDDVANGFALSWPYEFQYIAAAPTDLASVGGGTVGGKATVNVTGGRIGGSTVDTNNGYVFGGCKGRAEERYAEAFFANVRETEVNINYTSPSSDLSGTDCILGAVYGGGEDGHVYENTNVNISKGLIGMSVYGGGKGINTYAGKKRNTTVPYDETDANIPSWTAGKVYGNTTVTMTGGHVVRNIFGGGYYASVGKGNYSGGADDYYPGGFGEALTGNLWDKMSDDSKAFMDSGKTTVTVKAGTVGTPDGVYDGNATGMIYGGSRGMASQDVSAELLANHPRHEYAPDFYLGYANETYVTIGDKTHTPPIIYGSVYGGGRDGLVRRSAKVTINKGTIGLPYISTDVYSHDRGNVYGAGSGMSTWDGTRHGTSSGTVVGNTTVIINDGTIHQNVYGGGAMASVGPLKNGEDYASKDLSLCTVTINGGNIGTRSEHTTNGYGGNVFGSSRGGDFATDESTDNLATTIWTQVNIKGGTINGDVYGGGEAGCVKKSTEVNLTGGTIADDAYGGGKGTIADDAYGGGKGTTTIAADVGGDATVELNKGVAEDGRGCVVNRIFGCNDLNGSPKGHAKVHVYATQNSNTTTISDKVDAPAIDYDVQAVYGGGNLAAYVPTSQEGYAEVIIEGCDVTSIQQVYGGGNAAPVPATDVKVESVHVIDELFGGGNGNDNYMKDGKWYENPGANVGYHQLAHYVTDGTQGTGADEANAYKAITNTVPDATTKEGREAYYAYGTGKASTTVTGGTIHTVFGGSNKKGNIRNVAMSQYQESGACPLDVGQTYGGSKDAEIDAEIQLVLDCIQDGGTYFGGSMNADINSNVTINITNGTFDKVFGGNNKAGTINGDITINIEEKGCTPIMIGELYGGGYLAPYSVYGYKMKGDAYVYEEGAKDEDGNAINQRIPLLATDAGALNTPHRSPHINIVSATSIGSIYGGGYKAKLVGSPHVNVNMQQGMVTAKYANSDKFTVGEHTDTKGNKYVVESRPVDDNGVGDAMLAIGTIGNIYGGGNMADIVGDTYVEIGTGQWLNQNDKLETKGTDGITYTYNAESKKWEHIVEGSSVEVDELPAPARNAANITESVYGGGNQADVTGNTYVTMANGTVGDRIFGGGNLGNVGTISNRTAVKGHSHSGDGDCLGGKPNFADGTGICTVTVSGGQVGPTGMMMPDDFGYVFGASRGELRDPADDPDIDFRAYVQKTDVTISGTAFITGGVYGGSENGRVRGDTYVTIDGDCQIGSGSDKTTAYASTDFINPATATARQISEAALAMPGCAHWEFRSPWVPYDAHPYDATADTTGSDGHTFYGNVFGGGSGYFPYLKNGTTSEYEWLESAGQVDGDTHLTISGGHILTNAYGGNELTDVTGTCYVTMTGGTIGVPRTEEQIKAHPVVCNLFGAGKGDQRVHFNKRTNVGNTVVAVSGGTIYGSVFGGGEDGHVLKNASLTIGEGAVIGTWGKSGFDGNVFGGGRGFSGEALTAGNVAGTVALNITGGNVLGSVYGGGRLASVGYGLYADTDTENYGKMREDNTDDDGNTVADFPRGHIDITISGGTIGNKYEYDYAEGSQLSHTVGGNVFAGGMGRMYQLDGTTPISSVDWWKLGNVKSTKLTINGGTIKSNVYGGSELGWVQGTHKTADNKDVATEILITGGTIGTEITKAVVETVDDGNGGTTTETKNVPQYTFGSVYGGGRGDTTEKLFASEDEDKVTDNPKFTAGRVVYSTLIKMEDGAVKGSIYGGGEVGNVGLAYSYGEITDANTDFNKSVSTNVSISGGSVGIDKVGSTYFGGPTMGNVYGGGSGDRSIVRCGLVLGNTNVSISEAEGKKTNIYHNVYGGGAFGTVGDFEYTTSEDAATNTIKVFGIEKLHTEGTGTATVTVTGGTIGTDGNNNGMVFGSSRGDVSAPQQGEGATTLATRDDYMAWVNDANVTIGTEGKGIDATQPQIRGSVYGSGENGHTFNNTNVTIHSGTIGIAEGSPVDGKDGANYPNRGNVYGGGCGTDTYTVGGEEHYNPLAGIVYGNTTVNIDGGFIVHNVYGAGSMGSVGRITNVADTATVAKHADEDNGFALSWPYEFKYQEGTGKATINITGGHIGTTVADGGDVYGAARGEAGDRYATAHLARVHETEVNINFPYSLVEGVDEMTYMTNSANACITGAVHGSGEDGYVYGDTKVTLTNGLIGHSLYGGGKGMGTYKKSLKRLDNGESYDADIYSVIAGKVMGNTEVTVTGGHVVRNVYGGGNMGSVGKGNYAGGADDYSTTGYGETLRGNLWDEVSDDSKAFMNSGKTKVVVTGGTIGYIDATDSTASFKDGLPYGNVFGGSRGMAAPNVPESAIPRYLYTPTFFSGYVNETEVTIGTVGQSSEDADQDVKAPLILGSVYGGGQDGHVRRSTHVTVNSGEIGIPYTGTTTELNEPHWLYRGNVYGAGSGISEFEYDFNGDGDYDDEFVIDGKTYAEKGYSTSAGSVTHFTKVDVRGGTVYRNVVGGGSLASVGPPKITQTDYAYCKGDTIEGHTGVGRQSLNLVNIGGLEIDGKYVKVNIGEATGVAAGYGGNVFGGGRGDESLGSGFGTSVWTKVNILDGANILGNVFGGGNAGEVLKDTDVQIGRKDE